jgi:hypothetical protein
MRWAKKVRPVVWLVTLLCVAGSGIGCKGEGKVKPYVAQRVWDLTGDDAVTVQAAIDFLLNQNPKYVVPALMEKLDDMNPLAVQNVLIQDMRDPAAPVRRYQPKKYCDLIAALLHHVTGISHGNIYNGAGDTQRIKTIAAWQTWWSANQQYYQ